ncbi:1-phosphofructokinase family hexose kinase [Zongyangia hominis]|uniref:Tagatose-6-phosphate kinase n=1 Tax=Zongyangia hominis TaxID=2763677 RepID=A0A926IB58_9FIRM|nr:1-phosphofructokinase family hexose kinase [Zongyangia hominis]MBC8570901.1 1-phosphofructokinase family hexose kinase [Zongyangia hominis]
MKTEKILTVTLNPAIDVNVYVDMLDKERVNFSYDEHFDAAGKGTNVSRALTKWGIGNTALLVTGKDNAKQYFDRLAEENIQCMVVYNEGKIRENLSIITDDGNLYKLNRQGSRFTQENFDEAIAKLDAFGLKGAIVVFAGSLPVGMSKEDFMRMVAYVRDAGAVVALDSNALSAAQIVELRPWTIKPNQEELEAMTGKKASSYADIVAIAREIIAKGIENVIVSLGGDGLIGVCADTAVKVDVPDVVVRSNVGAGDTTLSGFIAAVSRDDDFADAVKYAAACGTAAVTTEGTNPPSTEKVGEILAQVTVKPL